MARNGKRRLFRWLAVGVLCAVAAGVAGGTSEQLAPYAGDSTPGSDSARADAIFTRVLRADPMADVIVVSPTSQRRQIVSKLRQNPDVALVTPTVLHHEDSETLVIRALLRAEPAKRQQSTAQQLNRIIAAPGIYVGGSLLAYAQANRISSEDLRHAELIALPILFLLLLVVFRSAVAALIPIAFALLSIVWTLAILRGVAELTTISVFSLNLVAALGIGLSIDFTLLVISRFREELVLQDSAREAARVTVRNAGRTVAFSCLTIVAALSVLVVFRVELLRSLGIGGVVVTAAAGILAVGLLPALLTVLGGRINAFAPPWPRRQAPGPDRGGGLWRRWSRWVVDHGAAGVLIAVALLTLMAIPASHLQITSAADYANLPSSASAHRAAAQIESASDGSASPLLVVAPRDSSALKSTKAELDQLGIASKARELQRDGYAFVEAPISAKPYSAAAEGLVTHLRKGGALVTGPTARFLDYRQGIEARLLLAIALAVGATLLLVFALSRSIVIPLKTVLANAITIASVFGLLVWALQDGHLSGLLGYRIEDALIDPTIPIFVVALAFGLSTDYGIFLLSRALEGRRQGLSDKDAVSSALARTGGLITSVALLFCVAVGAIVTSRIGTIKEAGVGMVAAVAIDATIVRCLLVPAAMSVLGRWNWWAPGPLGRRDRPEEPRPALSQDRVTDLRG